MTTQNGATIPTMKIENAPSPQIKDEAADGSPSPYMEEDDVYEDAGDLDFSQSQQQFWLSRVPKSLWELWASMPEDGEIEIGTIRVEGGRGDPKRVRLNAITPRHLSAYLVPVQVSLKLNPLSQFDKQPKEYNLLVSRRETLLPKRPRNAFVFSERDMPGFKRKSIGARDEEGNNYHGRSYLHEKNKRDSKRRESKKRFEPYTRRAIPKQTAIRGAVSREFECIPVENDEYRELEKQKAEIMLKPKEQVETSFDQLKRATYLAPGTVDLYGKTNTAKVSLPPFPTLFSQLTLHSRNRNEEWLQRRIVLLACRRTSLWTCCSTCSNTTGTGGSGNSRRKPISQTPICVRFSLKSPRCGRAAT
jgi:transcription initiation factor TFIIF subunit beta